MVFWKSTTDTIYWFLYAMSIGDHWQNIWDNDWDHPIFHDFISEAKNWDYKLAFHLSEEFSKLRLSAETYGKVTINVPILHVLKPQLIKQHERKQIIWCKLRFFNSKAPSTSPNVWSVTKSAWFGFHAALLDVHASTAFYNVLFFSQMEVFKERQKMYSWAAFSLLKE